MNYADFIRSKSQIGGMSGFEPLWMPDFLFDFQKHLVEWSIRHGRALIAADCGLGKTPMQLVVGQNCAMKTDKPSLIITPLAVAYQTVREAEKFGMEAAVSRDGSIKSRIVVTNYERLHYFDPDDFGFVGGDEISCIKSFDGKRRKQVTRFLSKVKYRGGYTATAAPNDFIELGTISEALGGLSQSDMIGTFFKSSDNMRHSLFKEGDFWNRAKYFFRAHSEAPFWRWVCSWARALRSPADLGFDGSRFVLPPLNVEQHIVKTDWRPDGELFVRVARTLAEQRQERKRTINERCERMAAMANHNEPCICWCQYNPEGDLLEKLIPDAVQVAGCNSDDEKEERLEGFATGKFRVLISKPKIAAFGMNYQHCGHQMFFPSHSFEQYYQAVRRSYRFGRVGPVKVDVIATEGEAGVTANLQKKQVKADQMFTALVRYMNDGMGITVENKHVNKLEVPEWMGSGNGLTSGNGIDKLRECTTNHGSGRSTLRKG